MGVGYGPKLFPSVLRFQRLLDLAASAGIRGILLGLQRTRTTTDQAHMTPEVQRSSGNAPGYCFNNALLALCGLLGTHPLFLSSAQCCLEENFYQTSQRCRLFRAEKESLRPWTSPSPSRPLGAKTWG